MYNFILLDAAPAADAPAGFGSSPLLMIGMMIVVVIVFMVLPNMRKSKEAKKFKESLAAGDKIVTIGGFHGKIRDVKDDVIVLEIAENVRIKIDKAAISTRVNDTAADK